MCLDLAGEGFSAQKHQSRLKIHESLSPAGGMSSRLAFRVVGKGEGQVGSHMFVDNMGYGSVEGVGVAARREIESTEQRFFPSKLAYRSSHNHASG